MREAQGGVGLRLSEAEGCMEHRSSWAFAVGEQMGQVEERHFLLPHALFRVRVRSHGNG